MKWEDYQNVGRVRATNLESIVGTPEEFIEICEKENPSVPTWVALDLTRLTKARRVGNKTASSIVDQMVVELVDTPSDLVHLP